MKLCIDCKHCLRPDLMLPVITYARCQHPLNSKGQHPVDGSLVPIYTFCEFVRNDTNLCGPIGAWHE